MTYHFHPYVYIQKICFYVHQKICTRIAFVILFTIAPNQKQPKCQSIVKWIDAFGIWHRIPYEIKKKAQYEWISPHKFEWKKNENCQIQNGVTQVKPDKMEPEKAMKGRFSCTIYLTTTTITKNFFHTAATMWVVQGQQAAQGQLPRTQKHLPDKLFHKPNPKLPKV